MWWSVHFLLAKCGPFFSPLFQYQSLAGYTTPSSFHLSGLYPLPRLQGPCASLLEWSGLSSRWDPVVTRSVQLCPGVAKLLSMRPAFFTWDLARLSGADSLLDMPCHCHHIPESITVASWAWPVMAVEGSVSASTLPRVWGWGSGVVKVWAASYLTLWLSFSSFLLLLLLLRFLPPPDFLRYKWQVKTTYMYDVQHDG